MRMTGTSFSGGSFGVLKSSLKRNKMGKREIHRLWPRKATAPEPFKRTASLDALMEQSRRIVFAVNPERESAEIMRRENLNHTEI